MKSSWSSNARHCFTGFVSRGGSPSRPSGGGGAQQETILRSDRRGDRLCPDAIALPLETHGAEDIDRHRRFHPARQLPGIAAREIVTARQNGYAGARRRRAFENAIRERAARVARDDDVGGLDLDVVEHARDNADAPGQARPGLDERLVHFLAGGRQSFVDDERLGRRVVQDEHDLREQPMPCSEIDDPAAAKQSPHPSRDFPRLVQLLAWKTSRMADSAAESIEERVAGEAREVVPGQAPARGWQESHASILPLLAPGLAVERVPAPLESGQHDPGQQLTLQATAAAPF